MIRKAEREQRQAIDRYNQEARRYNSELKRAEREYNRDVDKHNAAVRQQKREIDAYNRKAKAHNTRVRQDRQRLINELKRLERQASTAQSVPVQASVRVLNEAYQRVDVASESWSGSGVALADLAEAETANSAAAANALLGDEADLRGEETVITDELRVISPELDKRWQGGLVLTGLAEPRRRPSLLHELARNPHPGNRCRGGRRRRAGSSTRLRDAGRRQADPTGEDRIPPQQKRS